MKLGKKVLVALLSATCITAGAFGFAACSNGKDGADGADGKDGLTPSIGSNGNWFIGDTDTGVSATGPAGATGSAGPAGSAGSAGEQGEQGEQGVSVVYVAFIGEDLIVYYSDGTSQVVPMINTFLHTGNNEITIPAVADDITFMYEAEKAGDYAISFSGAMVGRSGGFIVTVDEKDYTLDASNGFAAVVKLGEGANEIVVSSSALTDVNVILAVNECVDLKADAGYTMFDATLFPAGESFTTVLNVGTAGKYYLAVPQVQSAAFGREQLILTIDNDNYTFDMRNYEAEINLIAGAHVVKVTTTIEENDESNFVSVVLYREFALSEAADIKIPAYVEDEGNMFIGCIKTGVTGNFTLKLEVADNDKTATFTVTVIDSFGSDVSYTLNAANSFTEIIELAGEIGPVMLTTDSETTVDAKITISEALKFDANGEASVTLSDTYVPTLFTFVPAKTGFFSVVLPEDSALIVNNADGLLNGELDDDNKWVSDAIYLQAGVPSVLDVMIRDSAAIDVAQTFKLVETEGPELVIGEEAEANEVYVTAGGAYFAIEAEKAATFTFSFELGRGYEFPDIVITVGDEEYVAKYDTKTNAYKAVDVELPAEATVVKFSADTNWGLAAIVTIVEKAADAE